MSEENKSRVVSSNRHTSIIYEDKSKRTKQSFIDKCLIKLPWLDRLSLPKKIAVVAGILSTILILVIGVSAGIQNYINQNELKNKTAELKKIKSTENPAAVVESFGVEKGNNTKQLQSSDSSEWDREKLDKVYFNLIYADKVGSFNEVNAMLSFIEAAEKSGLDINDNSYGIDDTTRSEIKARADKQAETVKKGSRE